MDIVAKHVEADADGVRMAELDEMSYRRLLWDHRPLTDFWRVGGLCAQTGGERHLHHGDVARCSIRREDNFYNEDLLYRMFGINAELLIDHAWGYEPCTMDMIKSYRPTTNSLCSGQVLQCPYDFTKTRLVVQEMMIDLQVLDLVDKGLVTDQVVLTIGYDIENLTDPKRRKAYRGEVTIDRYGASVPKHAHGTANLGRHTSSTRLVTEKVLALYDRIVDPALLVRRINLSVNHLIPEADAREDQTYEQLDLFTDYRQKEAEDQQEKKDAEREKNIQHAMIDIKKKIWQKRHLKRHESARGRDGKRPQPPDRRAQGMMQRKK